MSEQTDLSHNLVSAPAKAVNISRQPEPDMIIGNPRSGFGIRSVCNSWYATHMYHGLATATIAQLTRIDACVFSNTVFFNLF